MIDNKKSKLYPYIVAIAVSIYLSTQIITLASTVNIGVTLQEVAIKQKAIFEFLINQSIEHAASVSTYPNIIEIGTNSKDELLRILSFNKNIKIYDLVFFDLKGNLITESYEGFTSFEAIFGSTRPQSIIEPSIQNIRYSELYKDNVIDILVPVFENGKMIGLMWQVESFERIDSALKNVSILSTGESYIIDSTGRILTGLKDVDTTSTPITLKNNNIVNNALDGFEEHAYLNYQDEYVYGYHTLLNLNRWKLIVEVHDSEVVNTASNINSFLISSITLILATSKLLEPIFKNTKKKNKYNSENNSFRQLKPYSVFLYKAISFFKYCFICTFYRKYASILNIIFLVVFCVTSVISISIVKTDNDIQRNLDLSNQVNRRLISYYVNEIRGSFYSTNRTISESPNLDSHYLLSRTMNNDNNILNIVLLNQDNSTFINTDGTSINNNYAIQAIKNNNKLYNSTGMSDIFYDHNYNQYVFYLSGNIFDNKTNQWYHSIGVVSVDNLLTILLSNEVYSSKIVTILNKDKILYSNSYTKKQLSSSDYSNLKKIFYSNSLYTNSIFDVNKYKNIEGVDVFGSYFKINTSDVLVYGSYSSITDTNWELLYEEPVSIAKSRVYKGCADLLVDLVYQFIKNFVQTLS